MKTAKNTRLGYLKHYRQIAKNTLPKPIFDKLMKNIKWEVKETKKHFKNDRWDLDYHLMYVTVINNFFGFDLSSLFMYELLNACPDADITGKKDNFSFNMVYVGKKQKGKKRG